MNHLRCEANENANAALSIVASSSLGASYQERAGEVKTSSLEYRRGANSELWKISMICSANLGRFLKHGIHLLITLLTASRAERIQNFSLRAAWRSCGPT
ncbi:hypothetical protein TNCT_422281 [Trichonephila clavata]|uniref:Uncharacterized protein n=1 Tax=Trichonephila clavata TaxID=2740835 RepID=A0A8X6IHL0_TRICU|nr:hypothetical protein TNCT_422281 [Trichonephila clavata]